MPTALELRRLLSLVHYDARLSCIEGLAPLRKLLEQDSDDSVQSFLTGELPHLEGKRQGAVAFALAEHFRQTGDVQKLQQLYAHQNPEVTQSVLNALWGSPGSHPEMGAVILRLAIDATNHVSPEVRAEACSVIQNQCRWKVDVSSAVAPLRRLIEDDNDRVRSLAASAVGHLAKSKIDLAAFVSGLGHNVRHKDVYVRNYSAWALWQMSRNQFDINEAVPELVQQLTDKDDWKEPRKNAVGTLLHHARTSSQNRQRVRDCIQGVVLDLECKQIQRLLVSLAE